MKQALSAYKTKSFDIPESVRAENERAKAAQAAKAAETKKKDEDKKKDDKSVKDNKNAGNKLLDRITGKGGAKPSEGDGTKTN